MTPLSPELRKIRARAKRDVVWKTKNLLGFEAWSKQRDVLRAVREHPRVAVRSAHGVGKTAVAARVVIDFLTEGPSRVITTAPTWHQVEELLWTEIATATRQCTIPVGGKLTSTRLEIQDDWFALGLSTNEPERFQGHHAPRLLFVVDEASGVEEAIYEAGRGFLTAVGAHMLMIGNPTRLTGTFHSAFQEGGLGWHQIHISALDTPAFTGEAVPDAVSRALPSRQWVLDMAEEYGEDSAQYAVRVLGEFASLTGRPFFAPHYLARFASIDPWRQGLISGEPAPGGRLKFIPMQSGPVTLWQAPKAGHRYVIGADVAGAVTLEEEQARPKGEKTDASCAYVVDVATGEDVAVYHGRPDLDTYGADLARLGRLYNDAQIAPEMNGSGQAVLAVLKGMYAYPNIYTRRVLDTTTGKWMQKLGWATTSATRPLMLAELTATLRDSPQRLKDTGLLSEMRTFIYNEQARPEADTGGHDDRVMARAITAEVWRESAQHPITLRAPKKKTPERRGTSARAPRIAA